MEMPIIGKEWGLNMWEHEPGKSWARKEFKKLPIGLRIFVKKRLLVLMKKPFEVLRAQTYLESVKGVDKINVTFNKNEVRILGKTRTKEGQLPMFDALHIFQKKEQKMRLGDVGVALGRYESYKLKNKYEK